MSGGLPPDGLPAALHNGNLLPSFDQAATLELIDAPAASGKHVYSRKKQTRAASDITSTGTLARRHVGHIRPCSSRGAVFEQAARTTPAVPPRLGV